MVRVVCFDVGGVLIRITHRWTEAAGHAKVSLPQEFSDQATMVDAPLFLEYQRGTATQSDYLSSLAGYLGLQSTDQSLLVHNHIMLEQFDGVLEIVEALNRADYLTACLSNTNDLHWRDMIDSGRFPVINALQARFASHELLLDKPDPRIFKAFEEKVGARPEEIVFFDDSVPNLESATKLGWTCFEVKAGIEPRTQILNGLGRAGLLL